MSAAGGDGREQDQQEGAHCSSEPRRRGRKVLAAAPSRVWSCVGRQEHRDGTVGAAAGTL